MHASYLMQSSQRHNLIKLTHYDETKKSDIESQTVRVKANPKLNHGGPNQRQV